MDYVQYSVLGYLGFRTYALSRLPDAIEKENEPETERMEDDNELADDAKTDESIEFFDEAETGEQESITCCDEVEAMKTSINETESAKFYISLSLPDPGEMRKTVQVEGEQDEIEIISSKEMDVEINESVHLETRYVDSEVSSVQDVDVVILAATAKEAEIEISETKCLESSLEVVIEVVEPEILHEAGENVSTNDAESVTKKVDNEIQEAAIQDAGENVFTNDEEPEKKDTETEKCSAESNDRHLGGAGEDFQSMSMAGSERTHRRVSSNYDDSWAPFRTRKRNTSRNNNPFFAFQRIAWWEVRAENPHFNRNETRLEVARRWHVMPTEAKDGYRRLGTVNRRNSRTTYRERLEMLSNRLQFQTDEQPRQDTGQDEMMDETSNNVSMK